MRFAVTLCVVVVPLVGSGPSGFRKITSKHVRAASPRQVWRMLRVTR